MEKRRYAEGEILHLDSCLTNKDEFQFNSSTYYHDMKDLCIRYFSKLSYIFQEYGAEIEDVIVSFSFSKRRLQFVLFFNSEDNFDCFVDALYSKNSELCILQRKIYHLFSNTLIDYIPHSLKGIYPLLEFNERRLSEIKTAFITKRETLNRYPLASAGHTHGSASKQTLLPNDPHDPGGRERIEKSEVTPRLHDPGGRDRNIQSGETPPYNDPGGRDKNTQSGETPPYKDPGGRDRSIQSRETPPYKDPGGRDRSIQSRETPPYKDPGGRDRAIQSGETPPYKDPGGRDRTIQSGETPPYKDPGGRDRSIQSRETPPYKDPGGRDRTIQSGETPPYKDPGGRDRSIQSRETPPYKDPGGRDRAIQSGETPPYKDPGGRDRSIQSRETPPYKDPGGRDRSIQSRETPPYKDPGGRDRAIQSGETPPYKDPGGRDRSIQSRETPPYKDPGGRDRAIQSGETPPYKDPGGRDRSIQSRETPPYKDPGGRDRAIQSGETPPYKDPGGRDRAIQSGETPPYKDPGGRDRAIQSGETPPYKDPGGRDRAIQSGETPPYKDPGGRDRAIQSGETPPYKDPGGRDRAIQSGETPPYKDPGGRDKNTQSGETPPYKDPGGRDRAIQSGETPPYKDPGGRDRTIQSGETPPYKDPGGRDRDIQSGETPPYKDPGGRDRTIQSGETPPYKDPGGRDRTIQSGETPPYKDPGGRDRTIQSGETPPYKDPGGRDRAIQSGETPPYKDPGGRDRAIQSGETQVHYNLGGKVPAQARGVDISRETDHQQISVKHPPQSEDRGTKGDTNHQQIPKKHPLEVIQKEPDSMDIDQGSFTTSDMPSMEHSQLSEITRIKTRQAELGRKLVEGKKLTPEEVQEFQSLLSAMASETSQVGADAEKAATGVTKQPVSGEEQPGEGSVMVEHAEAATMKEIRPGDGQTAAMTDQITENTELGASENRHTMEQPPTKVRKTTEEFNNSRSVVTYKGDHKRQAVDMDQMQRSIESRQSRTPQSVQKSIQVENREFLLYIKEEKKVADANIHFDGVSDKSIIKLTIRHHENVWESGKLTLSLKEKCSYYYSIKYEKGFFERSSKKCVEEGRRPFLRNKNIHYDTFRNPESKLSMDQNEENGKFFYFSLELKHFKLNDDRDIASMDLFCYQIGLYQTVRMSTIQRIQKLIDQLCTYYISDADAVFFLLILANLVHIYKDKCPSYEYQSRLESESLGKCLKKLRYTNKQFAVEKVSRIASIAKPLCCLWYGTNKASIMDIVDAFFPFLSHSILLTIKECPSTISDENRLHQLFSRLSFSKREDASDVGKMIIESMNNIGEILRLLEKLDKQSPFVDSCNKRIHQLFMHEMRSLQTLTQLFTLLENYSVYITQRSELTGEVLQQITKAIKDDKSKVDCGMVSKILLFPGLELDRKTVLTVVTDLLTRTSFDSCEAVLQLLNSTTLGELNEKESMQICQKWLLTMIKVVKSQFSEENQLDQVLKKIHGELSKLLSTKCLIGKTKPCEDLDRIVLDLTRKHPTKQLITAFCKLDGDDNCDSKLERHVKMIVTERITNSMDDPFILLKFMMEKHKPGRTQQKRPSAQLLHAILDEVNIEKQTSQFLSVHKIFEHADMWATILKQGYARRHEKVQKVQEIVCKVFKNLENNEVSYKFTKDLLSFMDKQEQETEDLIKAATKATPTKINDVIRKLRGIQNNVNHSFDLLKNIFDHLLEPLSKEVLVEDLEDNKEQLSIIGNSLRDGEVSLRIVQDGTCFRLLKEILDKCYHIASFAESKIFYRQCLESVQVAKTEDGACGDDDIIEDDELAGIQCIFEESNVDTEEAMSTTERGKLKVLDIIKTIDDSGMNKYKDVTSALISGEDLPFDQLREIFKDCDVEREIKLIGKLHQKSLAKKTRKCIMNLQSVDEYVKRAKQMEDILSLLKSPTTNQTEVKSNLESENKMLKRLQHLRDVRDKHNSMFEINKIFENINKVTRNIPTAVWALLAELSCCKMLVEFIRGKIDQDFRNLIDAVEEHSEQCLGEAEVSALMEVKSFLLPFLKGHYDTLEQMFNILRDKPEHALEDMQKKLMICRKNFENLRGLVNSVGNREELTNDVINISMDHGMFKFVLEENGCCSVMLTYKKKKRQITKRMDEVRDLRSRALLLGNYSRAKAIIDDRKDGTQKKALHHSDFVNLVDLAMEIKDLLQDLHISGHFNYRAISEKCMLKDKELLVEMRNKVANHLTIWSESLECARDKYYHLNYIHGCKLYEIRNHFENTGCVKNTYFDRIETFINPNMTKRVSHTTDEESCSDLPDENEKDETREVKEEETMINEIGHKLDVYFSQFSSSPRHMNSLKKFQESQTYSGRNLLLESCVKNGELYVAHLDQNSSQTIPVILELYANTTQNFPEASNILFCNDQTTAEDLNLFLGRSMQSKEPTLYCIANVENLSSSLMFILVEKLKHVNRNEDCLLAVIFRGKPHSPVIEQFRENVHIIHGMQTEVLTSCLSELEKDTLIVTSALQGQGKTERIYNMAADMSKSVVTLTVEGSVIKENLIATLENMHLKEYHALHIDVAQVENPSELDSFLFELIVLGTVTSGDVIFHLPIKSIYIEIANTVKDELLNSLMIPHYLKREKVTWCHFSDMVISDEPCSAVQVVCHYLDSLENGTLDAEDIDLTESLILTSERCIELLQRNFKLDDMSFSIVNTFTSMLAEQLKKLSQSYYFQADNIKSMIGCDKQVKSDLVRAMLEVSRDFSKRAVKNIQSSETGELAEELESRYREMIHWVDENHLFFVFHTYDAHTLSPVYRLLEQVPQNIQKLFKDQIGKALGDFTGLSQTQLHIMLERIVRSQTPNSEATVETMLQNYSLTPDNFLKMVLIHLRVNAGVPVVIMGETGCGKTRLISYLAETCGIQLCIKNIHAGTTEENICHFLKEVSVKASENIQSPVWIFFDEINTCEHLGLLSEIICHRSCKGEPLLPNIVLLAACNPYRLRDDKDIFTAGLEQKVQTDELSRLVYRVHPLPESLTDYVWDFGSLDKVDEEKYIRNMVTGTFPCEDKNQLLADTLMQSQHHMRELHGNSWCVSLRDVRRCIDLTHWFYKVYLPAIGGFIDISKCCSDSELFGILLSLSHCYLSRLESDEKRNQYWEKISSVLERYERNIHTKEILEIMKKAQLALLNQLELPPGTAKNSALLENVFVMFVCIVNKLPVFVVGKPGCSKSLSMQLLRSNMRGKQSPSKFFQEFPQMYVVSYQGSESSTAEGIEKVFDKARQYQKLSEDGENVLAVVLLDEIGLAAISRFNPLKVLHSLLEPVDQSMSVSVVGISNWALDSAKMNRAIHLSRPDLTEKELYETGLSIIEASESKIIEAVAKAYHSYQSRQTYKNFHGLRDFYSLVKYIHSPDKSALNSAEFMTREDINISKVFHGLLRNFGGLPTEMDNIVNIFMRYLRNQSPLTEEMKVPELIEDNIRDKTARHLMLVTKGDGGVSIISHSLKKLDRASEVIFGSHFEEDQTDEYTYRMLSRIILCMERGVVLVMKNLESIYGSLYDMLNQNYTVMNEKKFCRIAIGPYSCPMCHVHDDFRCIVLIDADAVNVTDPPFLNRFEKQRIQFENVLSHSQKEIVEVLRQWVSNISKIGGFQETDLLPGYNEDCIPSLVFDVVPSRISSSEKTVLIEKCKHRIFATASPDGVLRIARSEESSALEPVQRDYFSQPVHQGLAHYLELMNVKDTETRLGKNMGLIVLTHSSLYTDLSEELSQNSPAAIAKLCAFKSEHHLQEWIGEYFDSEDKSLLVLQCGFVQDNVHVQLVKHLLESHMNRHQSSDSQIVKQVVMVMHIDRNEDTGNTPWCLDFLNGWKMVMIDPVIKPVCQINDFLGKSLVDVLSDKYPIKTIIEHNLLKAFTYIRSSTQTRDLDSILNLINKIKEDDKGRYQSLSDIMSAKVIRCLEKKGFAKIQTSPFHKDNWQVEVSGNVKLLHSCNTLVDAIINFIKQTVESILATLIYKLEDCCAWSSFIETEDVKQRKAWAETLLEEIDISQIEPPTGPECYTLQMIPFETKYPFSVVLISELNQLKSLKEGYADDKDVINTLTEELVPVFQRHLQEYVEALHSRLENFVHDFCLWQTRDDNLLSPSDKVLVVTWLLTQKGLQTVNCVSENEITSYITELYVQYWCQETLIICVLDLVSAINDVNLDSLNMLWREMVTHEATDCNHSQIDTIWVNATERTEDYQIEDIFIEKVCMSMLPVADVLDSCGGIEQWQSKTEQILDCAKEVSNYCMSIHFLGFCNQLAAHLLEEKMHDHLMLIDIANFVTLNGIESIDSSNLSSLILKHLTRLQDAQNMNSSSLQEIFCSYFEYCMDADFETKAFFTMLECITKGTLPDKTLKHCGYLFHRIFENELKISFENELKISFEEMLSNDEYSERFERIDNYLNPENVPEENGDRKPALLAMLNDVVEQQKLKTVTMEDIREINHPEHPLLQLVITASNRMRSQGGTTSHGLFAAAFLRSFLSSLAEMIGENLPDDERILALLQPVFRVDAEPDTQGKVGTLMAEFLLKQICKYHGIKKMIEFTTHSVMADLVKLDEKKCIFPNGYPIMSYASERNVDLSKVTDDALCIFKELNKTLHRLPSTRLSTVSLIFDQFLLTRCKRDLHLDEIESSKCIIETLCSSRFIQKLLSFLTGSKSTPSLLFVKHEREEVHLLRAVALLHFTCIITSLKPSHNDVASFIRHAENELLEKPNSPFSIAIVTCKCGARHTSTLSHNVKCPKCGRGNPVVFEEKRSKCSPDRMFFIKSVIRLLLAGTLLFYKEMIPEFEDIQILCEDGIVQLWEDIRKDLNITDRHLSDLLNYITKCFVQQALEDDTRNLSCILSSVVTQCLSARHRNIRKMQKEGSAQLSDNTQIACKQIVFETEDSENETTLSTLFQAPASVTFEQMKTEFILTESGFPFFQLCLEYHEKLMITKHITTVLKWHKLIQAKWERHITRVNAQSRTIQHAIFGSDGSKTSDDFQEKQLLSAFKDLQQAIQDLMDIENNSALPAIPNLTQESILDNSLIHCKDSPLYVLLQSLVGVQNDFLDECLHAALKSSFTPLDFLRTTPEICSMKWIDINDAKPEHIIHFSGIDDISYYAQSIGPGDVWCDFRRLEQDTVKKHVLDKRYIECETISFFHFSREIFHSTSNILQEVSRKIQQDSQLPVEVKHGLQTQKSESLQKVETLLSHLEIVICLLKRTGAEPDDSLKDYMNKWMTSPSDSTPSECLPVPREMIHVRHLVALYETTEDHLCDRAMITLSPCFQEDLLYKVKAEFLEKIKENSMLLSVLRITLRRFIYRFLSSTEGLQYSAESSLPEALGSANLWIHPPLFDSDVNFQSISECITEMIPKEACLKHIGTVYCCIQEAIQNQDKDAVHGTTVPGVVKKRKQMPRKSKMKKT